MAVQIALQLPRNGFCRFAGATSEAAVEQNAFHFSLHCLYEGGGKHNDQVTDCRTGGRAFTRGLKPH